MPPIRRTRADVTRLVTVWVEDGRADISEIELSTGAIDDLALVNIDGIGRKDVLELAANIVRLRHGIAPWTPPAANGHGVPPAVEVEPPALEAYVKPIPPAPHGYKKDGTPRKIASPRAPSTAPGTYKHRVAEQRARQDALYEALCRHPEGIGARDLMTELGRGDIHSPGVPLGVLATYGRARREHGLWYPIMGGDAKGRDDGTT